MKLHTHLCNQFNIPRNAPYVYRSAKVFSLENFPLYVPRSSPRAWWGLGIGRPERYETHPILADVSRNCTYVIGHCIEVQSIELSSPTDPHVQHQMTSRSQNKSRQSDLDHHGHRRDHSHFKMNERVVVYDKRGVDIHGTVRWIQEVTIGGDRLIGIGIETVRYMHMYCIHKLGNFRCMKIHTQIILVQRSYMVEVISHKIFQKLLIAYLWCM